MFDFSFPELVLCMVVALIVLGPEKLPKVARTVGRWAGQARGYLRNLTAELDREAKLAELKQQFDQAKNVVREQTSSLQSALDRTVADVKNDVKEVRDEGSPAAPLPAPPSDDPPSKP